MRSSSDAVIRSQRTAVEVSDKVNASREPKRQQFFLWCSQPTVSSPGGDPLVEEPQPLGYYHGGSFTHLQQPPVQEVHCRRQCQISKFHQHSIPSTHTHTRTSPFYSFNSWLGFLYLKFSIFHKKSLIPSATTQGLFFNCCQVLAGEPVS